MPTFIYVIVLTLILCGVIHWIKQLREEDTPEHFRIERDVNYLGEVVFKIFGRYPKNLICYQVFSSYEKAKAWCDAADANLNKRSNHG